MAAHDDAFLHYLLRLEHRALWWPAIYFHGHAHPHWCSLRGNHGRLVSTWTALFDGKRQASYLNVTLLLPRFTTLFSFRYYLGFLCRIVLLFSYFFTRKVNILVGISCLLQRAGSMSLSSNDNSCLCCVPMQLLRVAEIVMIYSNRWRSLLHHVFARSAPCKGTMEMTHYWTVPLGWIMRINE